MTSVLEEAICINCGRLLPTGEFGRNINMRTGLDSFCRGCRRETNRQAQIRRPEQRRPESPHHTRARQALEEGDVLNFSRHVCEHVAWYVQRKINEFEAVNFMEAPPHMTAVLTVARSISAQHPPKPRPGQTNSKGTFDLTCRQCSAPFEALSPTREHCDRCRIRNRKEQKQAWYKTEAGQAYRKLERERNRETTNARRKQTRAEARAARPPTPAIIIQCKRCGTAVEARTSTRKYCTACAYVARVEANRAWSQTEHGKERLRAGRIAYKQRQKEKLLA